MASAPMKLRTPRNVGRKAGQRALLFSLVAHLLLATFLLVRFVVDRAYDARADGFLTVTLAQDAPEKRLRRRRPRLRKQVTETAAPPATHTSKTREVATLGVPMDGGYAPSAPVSVGWEGPSVATSGAPTTPATRFEAMSRPASAPVGVSAAPASPVQHADALRVATGGATAAASLPTPARQRVRTARAAAAPRFDPTLVAAPGPGQKTMTAADIARVPGTTGDVLKALSVMPGISSPMDMSGELFVRGGSAQENRFYFDRILLGYPYHFGGLTSTISSDIIDRVDVHAGGFGAQFGEAQAVIDIFGRPQNRTGFRGSVDVNPLLSEWFAQSQVGENASAYVAGRRSYADLIVPKIIDIEQITAFPRFWDYQVGGEVDLSDRHHLSVTTFAAQDFMELFFDLEDVDDEPEFAGAFHYQYGFYGRGATLTSAVGERGRLLSTLSQYGFDVDFGFGDGFFLNIDQDLYSLRQDATLPLTDSHTLELGHESLTGDTRTAGFFSLPPQEGDPEFDIAEEAKIAADSSQRFTWVQGYVQDRARLTERLELTLGGRIGYFNLTGDTRVDPRASLAYEWEAGPTLRAAWGVYRQSPQPPEILKNWGNPALTSTRATHYILELERQFSDELLLKLAGYYKELDDLVTRDPVAVYLNQGEGFARGLELFAKYTPSDKLIGWMSYTYGRSDRRDTPTDVMRPFSFDQTHVATTAFNYRPSSKWDLGFKWQYSTGLPYTPVLRADAVTLADGSVDYEPVFGPLNSQRLAAFHRLDVRLARRFGIAGAPAEMYLEVLNAYNRRNVFQLEYNDDYTEQEPVYQLPLIPFIGLSTTF